MCIRDSFLSGQRPDKKMPSGKTAMEYIKSAGTREKRVIKMCIRDRDTMEAFQWLKEKGVQQFYFKYCSTFDSTPEGNIGPVLDAAMEFLQVPCTVLCPALPVNGRVAVSYTHLDVYKRQVNWLISLFRRKTAES